MPSRHSFKSIAALIALSAVAGCANSGKQVTLLLSHAEGEAIAAAHVRAIAIETSDVPLPVSLENLSKLDRSLISGVTDDHGAVRLSVRDGGAYLVEVTGPAFGSLAGAGPWRYKLDADGKTITPVVPTDGEVAAASINLAIQK